MSITSKELSWIEDQLSLEQLMVKKYKIAENLTEDEALKTKIKDAGERHQKHYDKLLSHLN